MKTIDNIKLQPTLLRSNNPQLKRIKLNNPQQLKILLQQQ